VDRVSRQVKEQVWNKTCEGLRGVRFSANQAENPMNDQNLVRPVCRYRKAGASMGFRGWTGFFVPTGHRSRMSETSPSFKYEN
jgi:hypothetical protein